MPASISLAADRTIKVMTNRISASANSEDVCSGIRFGEFVGQRRGDRVTGREQRPRQLVGVTDHEGHRHGFAQCAAQAQHHAADHTGLGVRQHDLAHHFPAGAAEAVGRFLQHGRDDFKHVAHHRGDERDDHHGQNQRGGQDADAHGGAAEELADQRQLAQVLFRNGCT
jgi:hypothetical protein